MEQKNLWVLAEERPKREVIANILYKFSKDNKIPCFIDTIRILPILDKDRKFSFLHHTEETKRKIGNAQKGKVIPEEVIKKRIETWKKKVSEGWKSPLLGSLRDEEK